MKRNHILIFIAIVLVAAASFMRVANASWHLYNFAPLAAIGLFSGSIMRNRKALAFAVPVGGQLAADLFFQFFTSTPGFYPGQMYNYAGLILATAIGFMLTQRKPITTLAFLFCSSTVFYLVSNFGYFAAGFNGYTLDGFAKTYIDALPFYKNTLVGDLIGGTILFASFSMVVQMMEQKLIKATT